MSVQDEYTLLRENHKKKQQAEDNLKPKPPECKRCGKKGHLASTCIQPKKPTDKE